jgi:hypothetical protein
LKCNEEVLCKKVNCVQNVSSVPAGTHRVLLTGRVVRMSTSVPAGTHRQMQIQRNVPAGTVLTNAISQNVGRFATRLMGGFARDLLRSVPAGTLPELAGGDRDR